MSSLSNYLVGATWLAQLGWRNLVGATWLAQLGWRNLVGATWLAQLGRLLGRLL
jgi:hypothetical protein